MPTDTRVRFCIVTVGRTGSTRLRYMLDSHPEVTCHGELLGENLASLAQPGTVEHHALLEERMSDAAGFVARHAFAPSDSRAVGFKVLYRQIAEQWPAAFAAIRADREVRIVHLTRRNLVKRFISEHFAGVVRKHNYFNHEEPPMVRPVTISITSLLADLEKVQGEERALQEAFRDHPVLEIAYEDSCIEHGPALAGLQDFLGIPRLSLRSPVRKFLPDRLVALIENFGEVACALRGTPYESMMGDET